MTYPHPKSQYRVRKWYAVERDDGRPKDELRAWLNLGLDKIERRHGVKVERRRMYLSKERSEGGFLYWHMEGTSYELNA